MAGCSAVRHNPGHHGEEAIRGSIARERERLRLSNEAGGIGTFTVDLESDRVIYSPELSAMFGVPDLKEVRLSDAFARVHRQDLGGCARNTTLP